MYTIFNDCVSKLNKFYLKSVIPLRCRESQLVGVRDQYGQLKDDFEYNLSLLSERDNELGNYDKGIEL